MKLPTEATMSHKHYKKEKRVDILGLWVGAMRSHLVWVAAALGIIEFSERRTGWWRDWWRPGRRRARRRLETHQDLGGDWRHTGRRPRVKDSAASGRDGPVGRMEGGVGDTVTSSRRERSDGERCSVRLFTGWCAWRGGSTPSTHRTSQSWPC
jgi:hypothetical protein